MAAARPEDRAELDTVTLTMTELLAELEASRVTPEELATITVTDEELAAVAMPAEELATLWSWDEP